MIEKILYCLLGHDEYWSPRSSSDGKGGRHLYPKCRRCGAVLGGPKAENPELEDRVRRRLYDCGYCDMPVYEGGESEVSHPAFGRLGAECCAPHIDKLRERVTPDGRWRGIDFCGTCGGPMRLDMNVPSRKPPPFREVTDNEGGVLYVCTNPDCPTKALANLGHVGYVE